GFPHAGRHPPGTAAESTMRALSQPFSAGPHLHRLLALLPGPTRKRLPRWYSYRLSYRNPDVGATGCVLMWEVTGGRELYQVALERDRAGEIHAHCTCADAIFRADTPGHVCKHIRGLLALSRPEAGLPGPLGFEAFVGGWV